MRDLALLGMISALSMPVLADSECGTIQDNTDRLACYDMKYKPAVETAEASSWIVTQSTSKMDDSKTVVLHTASKEVVRKNFGGADSADLYIRCSEGVTSLYVILADNFLADTEDYGSVTYRVDNAKPSKREMSASTDNKALGLWSGGTAIPFIKKMLKAKQITMRVTPYNQSPITVTFPVSGLNEALTPIQKACRWK